MSSRIDASNSNKSIVCFARLIFSFVGNLDEEGQFIALLISWSVYSRLICLDNQSPLTNVF